MGRPAMATNVWRGHAVLRADFYNERVMATINAYELTREARSMERAPTNANYGSTSPFTMSERRGPACCAQWPATPCEPQ